MNKDHLTGSISELKAAQYFLSQGYQVYFPVVRQGKVDFVIEKEKLERVQVKTATWNKVKNHKFLQCRVRSTNKYQTEPKDGHYDLLVVVYEDNLWIIPSSEIHSSNISLITKNNNWSQYKIVY